MVRSRPQEEPGSPGFPVYVGVFGLVAQGTPRPKFFQEAPEAVLTVQEMARTHWGGTIHHVCPAAFQGSMG